MVEKLTHSWGTSQVVYEAPGVKVVEGYSPNGGETSIHRHTGARQTVYVVSGGIIQALWYKEHPHLHPISYSRYLESVKQGAVGPNLDHRLLFAPNTRFIEVYSWEPDKHWDIIRQEG